MDDPALDAAAHRTALRGLGRINWISRTPQTLWRAIRGMTENAAGARGAWEDATADKVGSRRLSLLDVATGGGAVPLQLARLAQADGYQLDLHACDCSARALETATQQAARLGIPLTTYALDVLTAPLPGNYDIVTSALFLHHLDETQTVRLLAKLRDAAGRLLLVSDLRRGAYGLASAWLGTRLLSRSRVVHVDGVRSVRAAYSLPEIRALAESAGLRGAVIRKCWPARFLLTWQPG